MISNQVILCSLFAFLFFDDGFEFFFEWELLMTEKAVNDCASFR